VLILAVVIVSSQSTAIIPPFATSRTISAFSFTTGAIVFARQPSNAYVELQFGFSSPYKLLNSAESLLQLITGGAVFSMATPKAPPNVGPAAQRLALGDFTGINAPGVAQLHLSDHQVFLYQATTNFLFAGHSTYQVPARVSTVLTGDFNRDGKDDIAVTFDGSNNSPSGIAILMNKGDGTFAAPVTYAAGSAPSSIAAFDINHDGILDLAVTDGGSSTGAVYIFLGKGDGTFTAAGSYATDKNPASVTIADVNGDGNPDLAIATGNGTVSILLGTGTGTFRAATSFPTGHQPYYIAAGDFNNDGKMDLVTANTYENSVTVLLGKGDGSFTVGNTYLVSYNPMSLILADINGDGNLDIVQGLGDARGFGAGHDSGNIDILLGNGDGTFQGPTIATSGARNISFLATADFNGDGKLDAIVSDGYGGGGLYLFAGAGNGVFKSATLLTTLTSNAAAVGDFDGDGRPDLAVAESGSDSFGILLNSANGFQKPLTFASAGNGPSSIVTADFNGDGKLDLAVANAPPYPGTGTANVAVFFGNGSGGFQLQKTYPAGNQPTAMAVADLNGDGKPDLVVADAGVPWNSPITPGGVYVYLNNGSGGFQPATFYAASVEPNFVAVGDVNGDGKPDLVVATTDGNFVYYLAVLLNNGDGTFQPARLVPTDYGPASVVVRDFNGDGKADIVVAHCCGETDLTYLQGNGDGTFQPEVHFNGGASPKSLSVTDLNGDGKPDLIIAGSGGNLCALLNNAPLPAATLNWATGGTQVAPNSIASVYGTHLANATALNSSPPTTLAGTTVTVTDSAGVAQPALLYYASPSQLNIVMPGGMASGAANVSVNSSDGAVSSGLVNVAAVAPGILTVSGGLLNAYAVQYDAHGNQTGLVQTVQLNGSGALVAAPVSLDPPTSSVYLLIYGTGIRGAPQSQVTVQVGSVKIAPAYSGGQPQYPGLDQINILLPYSLKGAGNVTLTVTAAGQTSNSAQLTIQ
jgi:uncharacterized protein (TIGR03437 family)